jgi:RNA-directed DNA polymerase
MSRWSPQQFRIDAPDHVPPGVINHALETAGLIHAQNPRLAPVFTLRHLAHAADVDYGLLRAIASRAHEEPYRTFRIRKRSDENGRQRFRVIAVPSPALMKVQRWITQRILAYAAPHSASVAFSKGDRLVAAVKLHCRAQWLIKMDVANFFESIGEIAVYNVFRSLGYQPLISLEMARVCTRLGAPTNYRTRDRWLVHQKERTIRQYSTRRMGHLPQGAPTSPMLANLAVREMDRTISEVAKENGLVYTRYADDITLSTRRKDFGRERCQQVIGKVYETMATVGLSPNITKTGILSPGGRKIVLGLLVDGKEPRLQRDFRNLMRQHIYYLRNARFGPARHAANRGFASILGFRNHVYGLAMFARQIEPGYGRECLAALNKVDWPL